MHDQAVGVLRESAITHLDETEHPFVDPDRAFNPGPHLDLVRFLARSVSSTTPRWR
jgi:hypothetical protein